VGTISTRILNDRITLALATEMDRFVPDPDHINALPGPLREYIHDLATRADPAGDVAEIAMLKKNNGALGRVYGNWSPSSHPHLPAATAVPIHGRRSRQ
jgi:hypothetical protein